MNKITTWVYGAIAVLLLFGMYTKAHATFFYTTYTIPYTVSPSAPVTANAGPDTPLPQGTAGISGITGTASGGSGTISSSTWAYRTCTTAVGMPACTNVTPIVLTPNQSNSATHQTTLVNFNNTAVGNRYIFRYTATDSLGATSYDDMEIYITASTFPDLVSSTTSPSSATKGSSTTISATLSNVGSVTTGSGTFTNLFQFDNDSDHTTVTASQTVSANPIGPTGTEPISVFYTFGTSGTWYARACADNNASFTGTINEGSNEGNNCSASWTSITVNDPPPPPPTTYTITASSGANGSVTPAGATSVTSGNSQLYTITPNSGYDIASVVVDGASVGAVGTYNFSNVTSNHTISATFSVTPPPPPPTAYCADGIDNDSDGKIDYPNDPGCTSINDNNETDPKPIFIEF